MRDRGLDVDAVGVVDASGRVGDGQYRRALLGEEARKVHADVAEALDGNALAGDRRPLLPDGLADDVQRPAGSRLEPPERAADVQRLPGDDAEHRVALVHRVRVEDPRHHRGSRPDVRRGDVLLGPDLVDDLGRVAARELLELDPRELLRVAHDPALRAAERDPHQRALPRHPHRERLDLVELDVGVVADPALRRPAGDVVCDPVALERLDAAVVHRHGHRDDDRLLALLQNVDEVRVDPEQLRDAAQLLLRDVVGVLAQM